MRTVGERGGGLTLINEPMCACVCACVSVCVYCSTCYSINDQNVLLLCFTSKVRTFWGVWLWFGSKDLLLMSGVGGMRYGMRGLVGEAPQIVVEKYMYACVFNE